MEYKENDDLESAKKQDSQATVNIVKANGKLLCAVFNAAKNSDDAYKIVDGILDILEETANTILSFSSKLATVKNLKSAILYSSKNNSPFVKDVDVSIADWYENNPDMQQFASPEFRKPHYPKFMRKPF